MVWPRASLRDRSLPSSRVAAVAAAATESRRDKSAVLSSSGLFAAGRRRREVDSLECCLAARLVRRRSDKLDGIRRLERREVCREARVASSSCSEVGVFWDSRPGVVPSSSDTSCCGSSAIAGRRTCSSAKIPLSRRDTTDCPNEWYSLRSLLGAAVSGGLSPEGNSDTDCNKFDNLFPDRV